MNYEVMTAELKPLDISPYCKGIFGKCSKTLVMSATILNHKAFCRSTGLSPDEVKFIQVQSDFPVEYRPIYPPNVGYLNFSNDKENTVCHGDPFGGHHIKMSVSNSYLSPAFGFDVEFVLVDKGEGEVVPVPQVSEDRQVHI